MRVSSLVAVFYLSAVSIAAAEKPPIEAYGKRPDIIDVALSPDGRHYAYIGNNEDGEYFAVARIGEGIVYAAKGDLKARYVSFADNTHAILHASETASMAGVRGEWEHSGAISFNIETKKSKALLQGTDGLYPAQTGLGKIVGISAGSNDVFMPAFMDLAIGDETYDLLKVDLDSGRGKVFSEGSYHAIDFFVDRDGTVLAREEFDKDDHLYRIQTRRNGKLEEVYRAENTPLPTLSLLAVSSDKTGLIVGTRLEGEQFDRIAKLGFDGNLSPPLHSSEKADVEEVLTDINRVAFGVKFSGMQPTYAMDDPALDEIMNGLRELFADASVHLTSWSDDLSKVLIFVEGGAQAPSYYVLDVPKKALSKIASRYSQISDADIGVTTPIEYKARDGRKIPAVITTPPGKQLGDKLPLIVMPHGGPEAYDAIGFDYMAQYFANRGYLVFQPNFRGSGGFGVDHLEAGYGEWGGKMQDDVTDGAELLIRKGWADGERTCIVGASYGGYAALAGGAFTPDLYKCIAAIAPVSDVKAMLDEEKAAQGGDSITYASWTMLIGDRKREKAKLDAISPVNFAANFKAPVLLLHGTDDTVVPYSHSTKMEAALKRANKSVKLVKLKGEDHWLSQSETRLQALKELDAFVAQHIGR